MRRITRTVLALAGATALLVGCSSGNGQQGGRPTDEATTAPSGSESTPAGFTFRDGPVCTDANPGDPVKGGTLTLAMLTEPPAIDPAVTRAPLATGGVEVLAVFDPLLRYDPVAKEYVPQLAESVEADDSFSTYTVKLRPDATFSDGTPVDAQAVKWSMDRYGATPTAPDGALWNASVRSVAVVDPSTVEITLTEPWSTFEVMLSLGPGLVVAPSSGEGEAFKPIGAGPFVLDQHTPRESIAMSANKSYWAGEPHLDGVRFIYLGAAQTNVETLKAGGAQAAMLRNPDMVEDLFTTGDFCGNLAMIGGGSVLLINSNEGRPGEDPRVRKAMQLAIDPQFVHDRSFGGKGVATSSLFPEYSRWYSGVDGLGHDPAEATKLLDEAKADGYDGKIQYVGSAAGENTALAIQAQLEAVGFTVEVDLLRSPAEMIERIFRQDFDTVYWALGVMESDVYGRLSAAVHSGGNQLFGTATNPERDALIDEFKAAPDEAEQKRILGELQTSINDDVPFVTIGAVSDVLAWAPNVHGIQASGYGTVLLGGAWIGQ